ncbi:MAG: hypothetical protein JNL11_18200 [Bdellovibrionaceae bacterium]|nr:hypothetical protein [Pseudobdellovibrionaceae bacterium]
MKFAILIVLASFAVLADITECNGTNGYKLYQSKYDDTKQPHYGMIISSTILKLNDRIISAVTEYYAKGPSKFGKPAKFRLNSKKALTGSKPGIDLYTIQAEIELDAGPSAIATFSCRRTYNRIK